MIPFTGHCSSWPRVGLRTLGRWSLLVCLPGLLAATPVPDMVELAPGSYYRGSAAGDADERPRHQVIIAYPFRIGRYEVTVGEFRAFVDASGYELEGGCRHYDRAGVVDDPYRHWTSPGFEQTDEHPVVCVSAADAQAYAAWLAETTGRRFRLPSEAEWGFAARHSGESYWTEDWRACEHANVTDLTRAEQHFDGRENFMNAALYQAPGEQIVTCPDGFVYTSPVGRFVANAQGLFDMLGNVWEWVADCAGADYNAVPSYDGAPRDGRAARVDGCARHVIRGGAWHTGPRYARLENRSSVAADARMYHLGFRVAEDLEPSR